MRDILLGIVIVGLLPLCLFRPWIGILVWHWLGLMNPHRISWTLNSLPISMTVAALILIGMLFRREFKAPPWNRELILLALLMGYFTLTSTTAWYPTAAWEYWQRVAKMVGMLFVTTMLIQGRRRIELLLLVVAASIGFYGFKGGIYTIATGGQHRILGPEGTMIGGNTFIGLAMVMVLPLLFSMAHTSLGKWKKFGLYVVSGLTFLSIPFTYSRGALLGLAVVIPGIFPRLKKFIVFLPFFFLFAYMGKGYLPEKLTERAESIGSYQEDGSSMQRIRAWSVAFGIAKDSPLLGAGFEFEALPDTSRWWSYVPPDLFDYGNIAHVSHSIYFSVLGQHGFIALAMFLALLLFTLIDLFRMEKQTRDDPDLAWIEPYARALRIGFIGYLVSGAFLNSAYFDLMYLSVAFTALFRREIRIATESRRISPSHAKTARD